MKLFPQRVGLLLVAGLLFLLSCKKAAVSSDVSTQVPTTMPLSTKVEKMKKFLSITLNVAKENVMYNTEQKVFIVLKTLKFDYTSLETRYDAANEYKLNHE